MKKILISFTLLFVFVFSAFAQEHDHEYAPLQEKEFKYKDWTYKNISTNEDLNLREYAKDKKLVMVFYYAAWCANSKFQMPFTEKMYEKYKDQGLGVVGVSLYASLEKVQNGLKFNKMSFPIVTESVSTEDRKDTAHYQYRKKSGDERKWGTPYNVFLIPGEFKDEGDVLTKKALVVSGELMEAETEKFIREKLGLPAETESGKMTSKKDEFEPCEDSSKISLKKN
ncbi:MAG: TlpA family protein disulfide reductase [Aridibacter sp.]